MIKLRENLSTFGGYKIQVPSHLVGLSLPIMKREKLVKTEARKFPRVEVAGVSMRVGKTTSIRVLVDRFIKLGIPVFFSPEDWRNNPHLESSYQDETGRSQVLTESQKWFAFSKFNQLLRIIDDVVFIQDVSPLMDLGYALTNAILGQMSGADFEKYLIFFQSLEWEQVPAPDLTIFLEASDDVLLKRAEKSRRSFETFDEPYIMTMAAVNKLLMGSVSDQSSILYLDTDSNDFSNDEEVQNWLLSSVIKELIKQGWPELEQLLV
jgi:deoxyadenosine/deoxycytidine kinase